VAFAFAGADLLVETGLDGRIGFAAGTFRHRFGIEPEQVVGQHIGDLLTPSDRGVLDTALAAVAAAGRIRPMVLRLNDSARTHATLAGILVHGRVPLVAFTFGPVARPAPGVTDSYSFTREVVARLRDGKSGELSLLEAKGWDRLRVTLSPDDQQVLRDGMTSAAADGVPGALAADLGDGRIGVLTEGTADRPGIVERLEKLLRASPAGTEVRVDSAGLRLDVAGLAPSQAARALRYALASFTEGGADAARATGGGLDKVIAQAEERARALRIAVADRRFHLRFQPVVSLATRHVHHYEALLRPLPPPGRPAQSPQDFVNFVEATGLSAELDYAVTEEALLALRTAPLVSVAVNISGLSVQDTAFRDRFLALLAAHSDIARRLLVELTETAEIEDMAAAAATIKLIREAGTPVCLDDFGAGAASFRYLRELAVDYVKIDGPYVQRAVLGPRERGIVSSMVELAGTVGARVVAEMIETEEQAILMRGLGVEFGQGWLFGRPDVLPGTWR
jgi:EAL domain-containing protein (putative c-di-GMP-specific phosphodiesterase class I)